MATRSQQFQNHPFQKVWESSISKLEELDSPISSNPDEIENFSRLKKAVKYVDGLVQACDPDIVPPSVWTNFNTQSASLVTELDNYKANNNSAHIDRANVHLDSLIQYLSPFVISGKGAAQALGRALSSQAKVISELSEELRSSVSQNLSFVEEKSKEIETEYNQAKTKSDQIEDLRKKLLVDGEVDSISSKIDQVLDKIVEVEGRAKAFSDEIFGQGDDNDDESVKGSIYLALQSISENKSEVEEKVKNLEAILKDLRKTHAEVFGVETEEGEVKGGLKEKYNKELSNLKSYGKDQKGVHSAITKQMNELLKGVTNAGLASSFQQQRISYKTPIQNYNNLFYLSIFLLFLVGFSTFVGHYSSGGWRWGPPTTLSQMAVATLMRTPLAVPIIWLTIFSSSRRAENRRLEEEYAHKETIARAYNGFKEQVASMGEEASGPLSVQLLEAAISSAAFNASSTLDKTKKDEFTEYSHLDTILKEAKKFKGLKDILNG